MASFIFNVILVAIAVVILGVWGILKEQNIEQELINRLHGKAKQKLIKALKSKDSMSLHAIEELMKGISASVLWSRKRVQITDPKRVVKTVLEDLMKSDTIKEMYMSGKKTYGLKSS